MAVLNYSNKVKYAGTGFLDSKLITVTKIEKLPTTDNFNGRFAFVMSGETGEPALYLYKGTTSSGSWIEYNPDVRVETKDDLATIQRYRLHVGLEVIVTKDESQNDTIQKYWLTGFDEEKKPIWERKIYGGEINQDVEEILQMLKDKKYGNVVYLMYTETSETGHTLCKYITEEGTYDWGYTDELPEGATVVEEYSDGMYAILKDDDDVLFEKILTKDEGITVEGGDVE